MRSEPPSSSFRNTGCVGWFSNLFGGGKKRRGAAAGVPSQSELETRPLADLHLYASKLGIKRYRLMRKPALLAELSKYSGSDGPAARSNGAVAEAPVAVAPEPAAAEREAAPARAERSKRRRPEPEPEPEPEEEDDVETSEQQGVLDVTRRGHGFLRFAGLTRSPDDAYVSRGQIRRLDLRSGDRLTAQVRAARRSERYPSVARIDEVNGKPPETQRPASFERMEPAPSGRSFQAPAGRDNVTARMVELVAPIGPGQSVLVSAPDGVDAATVLRDVGRGLLEDRQVALLVIAIGGDGGDWTGLTGATVETVGADQAPGARVGITQLAVEGAKRRAEDGADAVVLLDSATALANAHAEARRERSEDGDDSGEAAVGSVSRLFEGARDTEQAGSLTIVAIATDSGPLHDALADVAGVEIVLDEGLAADGLQPPIDLTSCRADERSADEQHQLRAGLRSVINSLEPKEAWEFVSEKLAETDSNEALLRD